MRSSVRIFTLSFILLAAQFATKEACAGSPSLQRWQEPSLSKMLQESDRAPVLNPDLLRRLTAIHAQKCAQLQENKPCFLTELDAGIGAHSDRYLLFRGEPDGYDQPMTSALLRGALAAGALCQPVCNSMSISQALTRVLESLVPQVAKSRPQFYGGHTFDVAANAWVIDTDVSNPLFDDKKKPAPNEILINSHFRGQLQVLKLRLNHGEETVLDPFVSYSSSPEVAAKFSHSYSGRGRIWMLSVGSRELKTIKGGACKRALSTVGIYDLSDCSRPRVYKGEREFDAYLHAPSGTIQGYFRR